MTGFSEAADRNRHAIGEVLARELRPPCRVLEIGSGTGQHAVHFARLFPAVQWLTSDLPEYHPAIAEALMQAGLDNLQGPLELDVDGPWPDPAVQAVYSSNTCHIMSWPQVQAMLRGAARLLPDGGRLFLYGPFKVNGEFTTQSNRQFDASLRSRAPHMGLRDLGQLRTECAQNGLFLDRQYPMPANNFFLSWTRGGDDV